jgi:hypothetical protein
MDGDYILGKILMDSQIVIPEAILIGNPACNLIEIMDAR